MKIRSLYKTLLALAAPLMVAACSTDSNDIPEPFGENFEGIVINVPVKRTKLTRGALENGEGTIQNLIVIAYKLGEDGKQAEENNTLVPPKVKEVTNVSALVSETYEKVSVPLPYGNYHIYVVANVSPSDWTENTTAEKWEDLSEEDIQKLEIKVKPSFDPTNIPMTCNYLAIRKTPSVMDANGNVTTWGELFKTDDEVDGIVPIAKHSTTEVYADLTFAVAKVRYSVINGKTGFLTMGSTETDRVQFINYADHSSLMTHSKKVVGDHIISDNAKVGESGAYYTFTDSKWYNYKDNEGPLDATAFAEIKTSSDDDTDDESDTPLMEAVTGTLPSKWVYRGTAYVPERLFPEEWQTDDNKVNLSKMPNPTMIKFVFNNDEYTKKAEMHFGGDVTIPAPQDGKTHAHTGIIRGVVYEIKAFTTEKEIALKVRVKPWAYSRYDFEL